MAIEKVSFNLLGGGSGGVISFDATMPTYAAEGFRAYRSVTSLVGQGHSSLESVNGAELSHGDTVLIHTLKNAEWVASTWRVIKPAAKVTNVAKGIIRLLDNRAHLDRTGGF